MRKLFLIIIMLTALCGYSTKYYASPAGGGNGLTSGTPCTMAVARTLTVAGDTIVPLDGIYTISARYNIPVGVSIIGSDSANVIFNCSYTSANFALESATLESGNQLLQGFTLNGNMVGSIGIYMVNRHNVDCNAISVKNFKDRGINNQNPTGGLAPSVTGCDVTNSSIVNCAGFIDGGSYGNLYINGCKDFVATNNYIEASFRSGDSAGFGMKMTAIANCIIDGNDVRVIGHNDGLRWAFALESNHNWGGVTYTNNNFQGIVDFAGYHTFAGAYPFSLKFLRNVVGHPTMTTYLQKGMLIEATGGTGEFSGAEIAYNTFKNVVYGIIIENTYANSVFKDIHIHHNLFAPLGVLGDSYNYGYGIMNSSGAVLTSTVRDIYIDNNTFIASNVAGTNQSAAVELPIKCIARNIRLRNNIAIGFDNAWVMTRYYSTIGTIDSLYLQNNIAYGNAFSNDPRWLGITPTNIFSTDNLKVDPQFKTPFASLGDMEDDYNLKMTSPAINGGLDVSLPYFDTKPDIGAIEYYISTNYRYVTTTGNDVTGNGSFTTPWLTAKYGIEHTTNGDTCIIGEGTFNINSYIVPPIGVSIMGVDSISTILNVNFTSSAALNVYSSSIEGGNHYIANIRFEGSNTAHSGISITRRSNVTIDKCSFHNFLSGGVYAFDGYDNYTNSPAISGINVYNSQFVNCTRYLASGSYGAVWHRGVKDYSILNTTAIANFLPGDSAGFLLKASNVSNVRISKCNLQVIGHDDGSKWAFAIEYNNVKGGVQIDSNNRIQGVIDFSGDYCMKGIYDYSLWIHHNVIGHLSYSTRWQDGIYLENYSQNSSMDMSDVIIEDNIIDYTTRGILLMKVASVNQTQMKRITARRNQITNVGRDASGSNGWGITWLGDGGTLRDFYFYNNTITAANIPTRSQLVGINIPTRNSTVRNWRLANNIITGFDNAPIFTDGSYATGTIDSLYLQNNNFYQNGNSNDPKWWGVVPTNIISSNNLKLNPLFVSTTDFRLQTLSPMINVGLDVGLPYLNTAPDIGAYEYVIENPAVIGEVVLDNTNNTTSRTTTIYAQVANDGGGTISERGVVWSTSSNPTTNSYKIAYDSGLGVFKIIIGGLSPSTKYYLRAYCINEAGTAYSNQVIINTTYSSKVVKNGKIVRKKGFITKD